MNKFKGIKMTVNSNVVHETEAQRRHARVRIPARLVVTDKQSNQYVLELSDISASGFSVIDKSSRLKINSSYQGRLLFNFDSVEFVLNVNFQVINERADINRYGCEFNGLGNQEISTIRLLITKFLGGEITQVNDVLTTLNRENFTKARKSNTSAGLTGAARIKAVIVTTSMLIAGVGAFSYLVTTLASHFMVSRATIATVSSLSQQILMPKDGNITFLVKNGEKVKAGMPVARIQAPWTEQMVSMLKNTATPDSKLLGLLQTQLNFTVQSPCDCSVLAINTVDGQFIEQGKQVLELSPVDNKPFIQATFDYADYKGLVEGNKVIISFPDGSTNIGGTIRKVRVDSNNDRIQPSINVSISPDKSISLDKIGLPVSVSQAPAWFVKLKENNA